MDQITKDNLITTNMMDKVILNILMAILIVEYSNRENEMEREHIYLIMVIKLQPSGMKTKQIKEPILLKMVLFIKAHLNNVPHKVKVKFVILMELFLLENFKMVKESTAS